MTLTQLQLDTIHYIRWRRARYVAVYPADLARHYNVALPVITRRLDAIAVHGIIARESGRFKPITILKKQCCTCGEWKPETAEFFTRHRHAYRSDCKVCSQADFRRRYSSNPQKFYAAKLRWNAANGATKRAHDNAYKLTRKRRRIEAMATQIRRSA